jgi:hypothetical protein
MEIITAMLLQAASNGDTTWVEWTWRAVVTAGIATLGGFFTQYVVPRLRRLREKADTAEVVAKTAKLKAEANTAEFGFYREQLQFLQDRIEDLESAHALMKRQQHNLRAHIDDLYAAIGQETRVTQARIKARLTTRRPNGDDQKESA